MYERKIQSLERKVTGLSPRLALPEAPYHDREIAAGWLRLHRMLKFNPNHDPRGRFDFGGGGDGDTGNGSGAKDLVPSAKIIDFIASHETFTPIPTNLRGDRNNVITVGYGHVANAQEQTQFANGITQQQAQTLLQADVERASSAVRDLVKVPLSQDQFDALTSFVYNTGVGHFASSTLLSRLNSGNYQAAADEFGNWRFSAGKERNGLIYRRDQERAMFLGK